MITFDCLLDKTRNLKDASFCFRKEKTIHWLNSCTIEWKLASLCQSACQHFIGLHYTRESQVSVHVSPSVCMCVRFLVRCGHVSARVWVKQEVLFVCPSFDSDASFVHVRRFKNVLDWTLASQSEVCRCSYFYFSCILAPTPLMNLYCERYSLTSQLLGVNSFFFFLFLFILTICLINSLRAQSIRWPITSWTNKGCAHTHTHTHTHT